MGVGIQVESLNAWYGKGQALYDINLKVAANHATALIGPSGCGKSTFIPVHQPDARDDPEARVEGRVRIGEIDATTALPRRSCAGAWAWCSRKANPFRHVDLRQRGLGAEAERIPRPAQAG